MMNRPRELSGVNQAPAEHPNGTAGGTTRVLVVAVSYTHLTLPTIYSV